MRLWGLLLALLAVTAACTKVGPVNRDEALLSANLPDSAFPSIQRTRQWDGTDLVEEWSWRHGELYISISDISHYYANDYSDEEDLIADIETWPALQSSGVTVNRRNITKSRNSIGEFIYAISEIDKRGDRCFVMLQAIPYSAGARFEAAPSSEASDGFISLYECRPADSITAEALEERLLSFAEALRLTR